MMRHTLLALVCAAVSTVVSTAFWPFSALSDDATATAVPVPVTSNGVTRTRLGNLYRDNLVVIDVDMSKAQAVVSNTVPGWALDPAAAVTNGFARLTDIPQKVSDLTNDAAYVTEAVTNGLAAVRYVDTATNAVMQSVTNKADRADTLSGYGITDAYTKAETEEKIVELAPPPGDYLTVSNAAMTAHADATNYTDTAILSHIATAIEDESRDKSLSAFHGAFLYEMVTNISERENGTWITVSRYIPRFEHYATNNYKAARIANERVTDLELWRRAVTNDILPGKVDATVVQFFTDEQKAQARANIGAVNLNLWESLGDFIAGKYLHIAGYAVGDEKYDIISLGYDVESGVHAVISGAKDGAGHEYLTTDSGYSRTAADEKFLDTDTAMFLINGKAGKPANFGESQAGNLASLTADGNLEDSGIKASNTYVMFGEPGGYFKDLSYMRSIVFAPIDWEGTTDEVLDFHYSAGFTSHYYSMKGFYRTDVGGVSTKYWMPWTSDETIEHEGGGFKFALVSDIPKIDHTDQTFSNEVLTVARQLIRDAVSVLGQDATATDIVNALKAIGD